MGVLYVAVWASSFFNVAENIRGATTVMPRLLGLLVIAFPIVVLCAFVALGLVARLDTPLRGKLWRVVDRVLFQWATGEQPLNKLGNLAGLGAAALAAIASALR